MVTVTDTFDRADSADLNGGSGQGPGDGDWVQGGVQNPPHELVSNQASRAASNPGSTSYSQIDAGVQTFDDDQFARVIIQVKNAVVSNWGGAVVRYGAEVDIDTPVGYMARLDGNGDFGIFEFDGAGSADQLVIDTFGASIDTDYEIAIRVEGTTIEAWILATSTLGTIDIENDTPTVTTTDATLTSGAPGLGSRHASSANGPHPTFATFEGGDLATSQTVTVGTATETDTAVATRPQKLVSASTATETDTAVGVLSAKAQGLRPASDLAAAGWDTAPVAAQTLATQLDEPNPDSSDFVFPSGS